MWKSGRCSSTFGAIVGGLGEQTLAVIGAFESSLYSPTETDIVLALGGRDGETALLLHGEVWVRVRVLTWEKSGRRQTERGKDRQKRGNERTVVEYCYCCYYSEWIFNKFQRERAKDEQSVLLLYSKLSFTNPYKLYTGFIFIFFICCFCLISCLLSEKYLISVCHASKAQMRWVE